MASAYDQVKEFFADYNGSPVIRNEIATDLGLSWHAVNRAITRLAREGYLDRRHIAGSTYEFWSRH